MRNVCQRLHRRGTSHDHELYLADAVLPAHSPEAGSSQDDGSEVLLFVQLLQTRVQVPALETTAEENTPETNIHSGMLAPSPESRRLLKPVKSFYAVIMV